MRIRRLLPLVLVLSACATRTEMVNMWVDPENPPVPLERVLVFALVEDLEPRREWEEGFAAALEQNHVRATPSYAVAPYLSPDSLDIADACARAGCEGFMVILRHEPAMRTIYVPGYTTIVVREADDYRLYCQSLQEQRRWIVTETVHPGWTHDELVQRCDVDVWMLEGEQVVWQGTTDVIDPISDQHAAERISDTVVFELSRAGIVPPGL